MDPNETKINTGRVNNKIEKIEGVIENLNTDIKKLDDDIKLLNIDIKKLDNDIKEFDNEIKKLNNDIMDMEERDEHAINPHKHTRLLDQLAEIRSLRTESRASRTSYLKQIESYSKQIQSHLDSKTSYLKQLESLYDILKTQSCVQNLTAEFTNVSIEEAKPIEAYKAITEYSASVIANNHRHFYDLIALPGSQEGFTPNCRLRELLNENYGTNNPNYIEFESYAICEFLSGNSMEAFSYPDSNSVTKLNDSMLKLFLDLVVHCVSDDRVSLINKTPTDHAFFASNSSPPEYRVNLSPNFVLLGSEAKGVEASCIAALPQCFLGCADSALWMTKHGLSPDDCVVPGVICYGECLQIVAVYLVPPSFPVIVYLSPALPYWTTHGRSTLSTWAARLSIFLKESITLLDAVNISNSSSSQPLAMQCLINSNYFYKPIGNSLMNKGRPQGNGKSGFSVSSRRGKLDLMMVVYEQLRRAEEEADKLIDQPQPSIILFPLGVLSVPSRDNPYTKNAHAHIQGRILEYFPSLSSGGDLEHVPCIIFPLLDSSSWSNERPPAQYADSYIRELNRAVALFNAAGVAHMDLRPANIMWRIAVAVAAFSSDDCDCRVEMKIIDVEDAMLFGCKLPHSMVEIYARDSRYPIKNVKYDHRSSIGVVVNESHNEFFLRAVSAWVLHNEQDVTFPYFMNRHHESFFV